MNLIQVYLPDFKRYVKNAKFSPDDPLTLHSVFYYSVPIAAEEGKPAIEEIYFYKPVGSFIYYAHVISTELPENITIKQLKQDFGAIEIPRKLTDLYNITGTLSK